MGVGDGYIMEHYQEGNRIHQSIEILHSYFQPNQVLLSTYVYMMHRGEKLLYMHMVIRLRKWKNGVDQGTPYSIKVEPFIDGCVFAHFNSNNLLQYFILG